MEGQQYVYYNIVWCIHLVLCKLFTLYLSLHCPLPVHTCVTCCALHTYVHRYEEVVDRLLAAEEMVEDIIPFQLRIRSYLCRAYSEVCMYNDSLDRTFSSYCKSIKST